MCGIAGLIKSCENFMPVSDIAGKMAWRLRHRGPDGHGTWQHENIALAHARLSIQDLSEIASQPMISASGRYVLVFNGEIYNATGLRRQIDYPYKGTGDTEVLLATIQTYGCSGALSQIRGMFAFAVWDQLEKTLFLARDRLGIKPLYYGKTPYGFAFASELKAFFAIPAFTPKINRAAQEEFLQFGCIGGEDCIFSGINKLAPGHCLEVSLDLTQIPESKAYWTAPLPSSLCQKNEVKAEESLPDDEILRKTEQLLEDAVRKHMVSDVPLGTFLSGGIDSPLITALMQKISPKPIKTFTIAFEENCYDESIAANNMARFLKTDHTEIMLNANQAQSVIPKLAEMYDEPFADSSQIPTALVCSEARKHVTVCLSGDGGDELFGGYNRHIYTPDLWKVRGKIPSFLCRMITGIINNVPHFVWLSSHRLIRGLLSEELAKRDVALTVQKIGNTLSAQSFEKLYENLRSFCTAPSLYLDLKTQKDTTRIWPELPSDCSETQQTDWMRYCDLISYLPDDILTKLDRASMAASLEARVPFLDHRIVEFALQLSATNCIRSKRGKWPLRMILEKYIPSEYRIQRKSGFGVPVGHWIKHDLRDWTESLLTKQNLEACGFHTSNVMACWKRHRTGQIDQTGALWNILMFLSWHQMFIENSK